MLAESTSDLRHVYRKFANGDYNHDDTFSLPHKMDLLAHLLEAINAHYPPLSLTIKFDIGQILPCTFTGPCTEASSFQEADFAQIKGQSFEKMAKVSIKTSTR